MRLAPVLALLISTPALAEDPPIQLGVGDQKVLTVSGVSRLAIGDPSIADVKLLEDGQLLVSGIGEGKTSLLIWKSDQSRVAYLVWVKGGDTTSPRSAAAQPATSPLPPDETLVLKPGESRTLHLPGLRKLAVGDPGIADLRTEGKREVTVVGKAAGETTVLIWREGRERYELRVRVAP